MSDASPAESPAEAAAESTPSAAAAAFIAAWQGVTASELASAQTFVIALCELLGVPRPHPTPEQSYMFERPVTFLHGDGSRSPGRIDCYRRGAFILESKKLRPTAAGRASLSDVASRNANANANGIATPTTFATPKPSPTSTAPTPTPKAFDDALLRARAQAEGYARALPASEGRPPFLVVVDVGHVIELYAEFTRSGATYTPFPDARSHRIRLADLADEAVRARLRALWLDPASLDPSRQSAKVTRAVAAELAELAKSLEADGHPPEHVAGFLTRCLFSMFAEDIGLLPASDAAPVGSPSGSPSGAFPAAFPTGSPAGPSTANATTEGSFLHLLLRHREQPATLVKMLRIFWQGMDVGGFNAAIAQDTLRFNGKLFKGANAEGYTLPLKREQVDGLLRAARANWREVEPAIFGTLLERALSPTERHALGAHYTPRAYVERLVLPTVVEPLRADWANAQAAGLLLAREADELAGKRREDKLAEARAELKRFHHQLCTTTVLDPACGSGNFLYVTLEHLKRLEGEVLAQLEALGEKQDRLGLEGETVTLRQLRGIELNERAAALAELVLWIGWLQWHIRTTGSVASVAEPVVHDYGNIEHRDAVLAYDRAEPAIDPRDPEGRRPLTRWDGSSFKTHPVTGEPVPDEAAQTVQWAYVNPRKAAWPQADFIVGNPPFIGAGPMRAALGDGYAQTLRATWPEVPESADFVMYWWNHAAALVRSGAARRFGFITTNSLRQTFNRRVLEAHLGAAKQPLRLAFAVPDHPWVDSAQGAAVRIAMSVGTTAEGEGRLLSVGEEHASGADEVQVRLDERRGALHADLRLGADVAGAGALRANLELSNRGVQLFGAGFIVDAERARALGLGVIPDAVHRIRHYRHGRDLMDRPRGVYVLDLFGLSAEETRSGHPAIYQWLWDNVKPERDLNNRESRKRNWWLFGETNPKLRKQLAGLPRYIATVETAKHRTFQFLDTSVLPDNMLIAIATDDALPLGVLSSQIHVDWMLATGGRLGVGNDPRYNKSRCFETFPFPAEDTGLTPALAERIRALAEAIDAHRKARQAASEAVTLTGLYNVLAALRSGQPLSAKERALHEAGLVSVLRSLHDELDAAVLEAYGWSDLGPVPWAADLTSGLGGAEGPQAARLAWTETLLERLVALNARRAAEEAAGTVRWLRPEYQDPVRRRAALEAEAAAFRAAQAQGPQGQPETQPGALAETRTETQTETQPPAIWQQQTPMDLPLPVPDERAPSAAEGGGTEAANAADGSAGEAAAAAQTAARLPWPAELPAQMRAVAEALAAAPGPLLEAAIAERFSGRGPWKKRLPQILETLEALGRARAEGGAWRGA